MVAQISLNEMEFYAFHGVMAQEQKTGHRFMVTLSVWFDCSEVLISDDVEQTVNYALLHDTVREEMARPSQLIEHAAGRIARQVLDRFDRVIDVEIELSKLTPPLPGVVRSASVKLKLHR